MRVPPTLPRTRQPSHRDDSGARRLQRNVRRQPRPAASCARSGAYAGPGAPHRPAPPSPPPPPPPPPPPRRREERRPRLRELDAVRVVDPPAPRELRPEFRPLGVGRGAHGGPAPHLRPGPRGLKRPARTRGRHVPPGSCCPSI